MIDWSRIRWFERWEFGENGDIQPDPNLLRKLDAARGLAGVPFVINSGIRSEARNAEVGGVDTSAHLTGHAVDIRCTTSRERFLIVSALRTVGFQRIGIGRTFVHCDTDPGKDQDVIWLYD